jgi:hypothetical protein
MTDEILAKLQLTRAQFDNMVGLYGRYQGKDGSGNPIVTPDGPIPHMGEDLPSELRPWNTVGFAALAQALRARGDLTPEEMNVVNAALAI